MPQVVRDVEAWLAVRGSRGEDGMFVQIKRDKIQRHLQLTDGAMWYILRKRGREAGLKRPLRPMGRPMVLLDQVPVALLGLDASTRLSLFITTRARSTKCFGLDAQSLGPSRYCDLKRS